MNNSINSSEFLKNYQHNYFKTTNPNQFEAADAQRKCISQIFNLSSNTMNSTISCELLNDMLTSYSDLIDDQNGINNYAEQLRNLTSNVNELHCSEWKSNLHNYNMEEFLEPTSCDCNIKTNDYDFESLFTDEEIETPKFEPINIKNTYVQSNFQFKKQNDSNKTVVEQESSKHSMFKTAKAELKEQNLKKYGNANGNGQYSGQGVQKKSLGIRRGVQSKFVPPMKVDEDEFASLPKYHMNSNNSPSQDEQTEVDERLKNIDPRMVEMIRSEIMDSGPPITWEDIAGLEFAKVAIKEAVVWPLLRPDIFTGLRRPPKGILLFGPPGTGKTLIGKCIASQSQSTFFSISASSLTSKWIGEGEKMVRAMFAVARVHQPAVIFIDEVDSLLSQRSDTEHESSRRIKTEFLVQLDGAATSEDDRILLVGATNRPQELDEAARRRFVKRLYIPLPEKNARLEIVKRLMGNERNSLSLSDMEEIAELSNGYSGADMKNLCSEASLGPIRSIDLNQIQNIQADMVRPVTRDDFKSALKRVRASVSSSDLDQYVVWDKTYGSGGL